MADITDITTGNPGGAGYFDKFMDAINGQLSTQLREGRIQSTDFANVYLGAMQTALAQAVAFAQVLEQVRASEARTNAEVALLTQKKLTEEAQIKAVLSDGTVVFNEATKIGSGAVGKQQTVQQAQADGFLRDAEQKATKILMDAWSISKSVGGDGITTPDGAQNDDIEDLIIKLRQGIGITTSIYRFQANAGIDTFTSPGEFTILDGSGSTFPGDAETPVTITSYLWEQVAGTNVGIIANNDKAVASFTAPAVTGIAANDNLKFSLTISSSDIDTPDSVDYVTITVQN